MLSVYDLKERFPNFIMATAHGCGHQSSSVMMYFIDF